MHAVSCLTGPTDLAEHRGLLTLGKFSISRVLRSQPGTPQLVPCLIVRPILVNRVESADHFLFRDRGQKKDKALEMDSPVPIGMLPMAEYNGRGHDFARSHVCIPIFLFLVQRSFPIALLWGMASIR